jgi:hypothetical protein
VPGRLPGSEDCASGAQSYDGRRRAEIQQFTGGLFGVFCILSEQERCLVLVDDEWVREAE